MHLKNLLIALLLSAAGSASQVPIVEEEEHRLSKVISQSRYLSLHRELCEIESVTNRENRVGTWLKHLLEGHHFKVITQEVPPYKNTRPGSKPRLNLYVYPDANYYGSHSTGKKHRDGHHHHHPPSPKVLLTSHIDTVPPHFPYHLSYNSSSSSSSSSSHFNRSEILITGRGTVDDKACVAAQVTAAMDFLISPPKGLDFSPSDIALLFVVDEESGGEGMRHFSQSDLYTSTKSNYKAILFGEPTERKLVSGHKGIFMARVEARGKAAHSGYPWLGKSANSAILPALILLEKLGSLPLGEGGLPGSEKYGNTTVNVGLMQGGVAANVVPESAFAEVAFRLASGTKEENQAIVEKAISSVNKEGLLTYEFSQGYGPVDLDVDVDGFENIPVNYGTDIPNLNVTEGVKKYLYGPGTIFVAHGPNEGLTVGEMEAGLEGYKRLLAHALQL